MTLSPAESDEGQVRWISQATYEPAASRKNPDTSGVDHSEMSIAVLVSTICDLPTLRLRFRKHCGGCNVVCKPSQ